jgi:hypothetical protein
MALFTRRTSNFEHIHMLPASQPRQEERVKQVAATCGLRSVRAHQSLDQKSHFTHNHYLLQLLQRIRLRRSGLEVYCDCTTVFRGWLDRVSQGTADC